MAERGAHLTGTVFVKPTIFEIVAQDSLASTLEPAFKKLFSFFLTFNPERYGWLEQWSDEAYVIFNVILQKFYLNNYSASFSETFYSLKRISLSKLATQTALSSSQKRIFLALLVLQPYIKAKAQQHEVDIVDGKLPKERWKQYMKVSFVKSYKMFYFIHEICRIYFYLAYMSDYSKYPSPIFRLLRSTLTYSDPREIISIPELFSKLKRGTFGVNEGAQFLQKLMMRGLEFGAFFLQFINWWNRENYFTNISALPVPPPPEVPEMAKQYRGICPICLRPPNIPTALSVSGYIFCYECVFIKVQSDNRCPVTKYPATEDDLIRVYMN